MIERMLHAEQTLDLGLLDQAERMYSQAAAADPHNAIAVIGLARVRLERDDRPGAHALTLRALAIDPENATALRMEARLREVLAGTGVAVNPPPSPKPPAEQSGPARPGLVRRLLGRDR